MRRRTMKAWASAAALALLAVELAAVPAHSEVFWHLLAQHAKLVNSDAVPGDHFGSPVAISGDTALVGKQGETYVFEREGATWTERQKLVAPDTGEFLRFGGIDGDTILAIGTQSVYVFVRDAEGWVEQQKIVQGNPPVNLTAAGIDGDMAVLCAAGSNMIFVFVREGTIWSKQQTLVVSDPAALFQSVDVDGDTFVAKDAWNGAGAVFVFAREGSYWSEQQRLVGDVIYAWENFGDGMALSGDTLAVTEDSGNRAYVYVRTG
jgi:hypothetical protein